MKILKYLKQNKSFHFVFIILSFIILSFISSSILLKNNAIFNSYDMVFHFKRIMGIREAVLHNYLIPNFDFNQFHGSAVMTLYPYINLLPIIILSFLIKSKITLIYINFSLNVLITLLVCFFGGKSYIKSNYFSYSFALVYSLSSVFLSYNFVNTDLGMVGAYMFLPLVIFGFINIIKNKSGWLELSIGMSLIAFSHVLSLLLVSVFLLLWLIMNVKVINKSILLNVFKSIIIFVIITSVIWLPFLNLYIHNFNNILTPEVVQLRNINFKTFFGGLYGSKNLGTIGFFSLITIFIFPFFYKKSDIISKQMYYFSIIIILLVLIFPWDLISNNIFKSLNLFQYTYRFLIIPQILLSIIFSTIISKYINITKKRNITFIFTIFISLFVQLAGQYSFIHHNIGTSSINRYIYKNSDYFDLTRLQDYRARYQINYSSQFDILTDINSKTDFYDYIPKKSLSICQYVNNNQGIDNHKNIVQFKNNGYNKISFKNNKDINKITLPIYAYNNEKLHVYLNNKLVNNYANKDGVFTINNIENDVKENNKVYIKPTSDSFRIIGVILSIFGWLFVLKAIIKKKFRH